mmetsp:Transcript_7918/g.19266  ORF Transcript_7918/g.19266 Transcript_7918/m.19266 type:complete len:222 (+) Transcript_7918:729-1394(+)
MSSCAGKAEMQAGAVVTKSRRSRVSRVCSTASSAEVGVDGPPAAHAGEPKLPPPSEPPPRDELAPADGGVVPLALRSRYESVLRDLGVSLKAPSLSALTREERSTTSCAFSGEGGQVSALGELFCSPQRAHTERRANVRMGCSAAVRSSAGSLPKRSASLARQSAGSAQQACSARHAQRSRATSTASSSAQTASSSSESSAIRLEVSASAIEAVGAPRRPA